MGLMFCLMREVQKGWYEARAGLGGQVREPIEVQRVGGEWGEKMA